jgi:hypothetical protein
LAARVSLKWTSVVVLSDLWWDPSGNQLHSVPNGRSLSALGGSLAERAELSQRGGAVDPYVFPADQALAELENMQNTDADSAAVARYAQEVTNYLGSPDFVVNDKVFAVKPMEHIRPLALHVGKQIAVPFCFQTSMPATPSRCQRCTRWPASISPTSSLPDRPPATHTIPHRWPASSVAASEWPGLAQSHVPTKEFYFSTTPRKPNPSG